MLSPDIERMCSSAHRAVASHVEFLYRAASLATLDDFKAARSRCCLPPVILRTDLTVELPSFYRCPECDGAIEALVHEWNSDDGRPIEGGVNVYCRADAQARTLAQALERVPEARRYAEYMPDLSLHLYAAVLGWASLLDRSQAWVRANVRVAR